MEKSATVNTGRAVFDVRIGQLWKSLDPRDRNRTVAVTGIEGVRVCVANSKTWRKGRVFLQDFVRRFGLVKD